MKAKKKDKNEISCESVSEITSIWSFDDLDNDPQIKEWREKIDQGTIYYA
jgi:hypothetical protein